MDDMRLGCVIWVDWANKIISFNQVDGFERKIFSSVRENLNYVMDKCYAGFRIQ